jgi:hypothetical protein
MSARHATGRLALVLLAAVVVAACDRSPTAPAAMRSAQAVASIEGDTLPCRNGWIVVNGRYECLGQ